MSKALKIVQITLNSLLGLIALIGVSFSGYVLIERYAYNNEMPTVFGYSMASVGSGSMEPTINTGDLIITKKSKTYEVDDIITFYDESFSRYITHRIIGLNEDGSFITQGDREGQGVDTNPVYTENIVGKVIKVYPSGGFMAFITSTVGTIVLIGAFIIIWLAIDLSISAIINARNKDKQKKGDNERDNE